MTHTEIPAAEQADRLAIRELVDAYAHCADRRDADRQKSLFTEDTRFVVYMDGQGSEPTQVLDGREALTPVFAALNDYQATMHFDGQSTVDLDDGRASGETYCIAHHLFTQEGERTLMVAFCVTTTRSPSGAAAGCSRSASSTSTGPRRELRVPDEQGSREHPMTTPDLGRSGPPAGLHLVRLP
jgi:hypothetical protein